MTTRDQAAGGSDLWPTTWAADDSILTSWGDGGGFGGTNSLGRVYIGVARVDGSPEAWTGTNLWGGLNPVSSQTPTEGKCNGGIVAIDGSIYIYITEQGAWNRAKLWRSVDGGLTWDDLGWVTSDPFAAPGVIQFGADYADARDNFVYAYGIDNPSQQLYLFRVAKDQLADPTAYEFFAGMSGGTPTWVADMAQMAPVFEDSVDMTWGVNAAFHPATGRYLLTVRRDRFGAWGVFDAPEPWGPWTTVAYFDGWLGGADEQISYNFPTKWMAPDGSHMWMVFSAQDSFNIIRVDISSF